MSDPEYYKWDGTPVTNFRLDDGSFVPVLPIPKAAEYALSSYMECFPDLAATGWADRDPDLCFKEGFAVALMERAARAEPMLTKAQIREIFLANGFTVKEGQKDLKDYVFKAAKVLELAVLENIRRADK